MTANPGELLRAALRYAELGYPVFPCAPGTKKPLTQHGFQDASADADQIEAWWAQHPAANIGIPTAGLIVIDIDGEGNPWMADAPDRMLDLATGAMALSELSDGGNGMKIELRNLADIKPYPGNPRINDDAVDAVTGRIRGMKYKRADGRTVRPTLVVLDDPQTDESARSLSQCATRESILAGAVLGLSGPGKKISGIMPCTVIRPGDMADNILNRDKHPEWNGQRTKMVYAFPVNETLWQRYAEIRAESMRSGNAGDEATEFYRANRDAMDEGAIIAWPERFNHDELSAIQHAMNLKLQDAAAFFAEYQNEPLAEEEASDDELTADQIATKFNRMRRGEVPIGCNHITAFIDVQANLLFFVVAAWEDDFTGYVLDYGAFPDQKRAYFTLRDVRLTLATATGASGLEGAIYAGLERLTGEILKRDWQRDDGAGLRIERCLIDANWGSSTDVVYQFCRQSAHASVVLPSHGRFVGASSQPFSEYKRRPGDRVGHNWRMPNVQGKRAIRHAVFDANFWKTFIHARLAVPMGERGCLSLFGDRPDLHRLLAEHLTAEYRVKTEGRGRTVDEWKLRPERSDNHWFDGLVGCAVAASIQGVALPNAQAAPTIKRERISFAELQRKGRR